MPKAPLLYEHLCALSDTLAAYANAGECRVKSAVAVQLKTKIDRKLSGILSHGYRMKLQPAELELVKQLNCLYAFHKNAQYSNAYMRLLSQNSCG
jgi:hypothetical protein